MAERKYSVAQLRLLLHLQRFCIQDIQDNKLQDNMTSAILSRPQDSAAVALMVKDNMTKEACSLDSFDTVLTNVTAEYRKDQNTKYMFIILAYSLIILVSFFGNSFVVGICFGKRRMRTTVNIFIGNLALSDLLMTVFNIPFTSARFFMDNWIFGQFLCQVVPFVQATSVYVSTLTMTFIAVDRYQAIVYPIRTRLSTKMGHCKTLALIWAVAILLSTPFGIFNSVQLVDYSLSRVSRCQTIYPEPEDKYMKTINVATFVGQFAVPLTVMVVLYLQIALKIWSRKTIGATTQEQQARQVLTKRKTIMMLILVTGVFVVCWLPLNVYHLLADFDVIPKNFNLNIVVHWTAMSSVCYNPFIYFWLNRRFQQVLKGLPCCCCAGAIRSHVYSRQVVDGQGSFINNNGSPAGSHHSRSNSNSNSNSVNSNGIALSGRSRQHPFRQRRTLVALPRTACFAGTDSSSIF
ncbi:putative G-protein coupled receptor 83 [Halotydeus destructor]|nr:putative G-protein coupled receptor 83 [Halotydeus destructor]